MKKIMSLTLAALLVFSLFTLPAQAAGETFSYESVYAVNGAAASDLSGAKEGDSVSVTVRLYRTDSGAATYALRGLELAVIAQNGLSVVSAETTGFDGAAKNLFDVVDGKFFKPNNFHAAEERGIDFKERIFGRRAD